MTMGTTPSSAPDWLPQTCVHLIDKTHETELIRFVRSGSTRSIVCGLHILQAPATERDVLLLLARTFNIDPNLAQNWDAFFDSFWEDVGPTNELNFVLTGVSVLASHALLPCLKLVHHLARVAEENPRVRVYFVA
jgi:hypothetical protein